MGRVFEPELVEDDRQVPRVVLDRRYVVDRLAQQAGFAFVSAANEWRWMSIRLGRSRGFSIGLTQKRLKFAAAIKVAAASEVVAASPVLKSHVVRSTPSLIEFPGLNKTSLPQWRKELGERVREVQERKAREATLEGDPGDVTESTEQIKPTAVLELLPQAEVEPMNPIVVAALQRIERAHSHAQFVGNNAMAPAYDELPDIPSSWAESS